MDKWTDRLSDYIDDELSESEVVALEVHLLECADCGRTLQELRAVVARAGRVIDRPPENDLWPAIADRLAQPDAVPGYMPAQADARRRISLSMFQLAAASIVLMIMSAGTMYLLVNRNDVSIAQVTPATDAPVTTDEAVTTPLMVKSPAAENYDVAIDELEAALANGRTSLDSATVRVLENNLRTIDVAISEARQALGRDPANPYLNRYLDQTMQRKIQLLRRATGILRAQT
ncbi:MAG: zf-HC2 domain-containing protein [Gemmatimonadota bacterium]